MSISKLFSRKYIFSKCKKNPTHDLQLKGNNPFQVILSVRYRENYILVIKKKKHNILIKTKIVLFIPVRLAHI
jgi:hypothetical protein